MNRETKLRVYAQVNSMRKNTNDEYQRRLDRELADRFLKMEEEIQRERVRWERRFAQERLRIRLNSRVKPEWPMPMPTEWM